MNLGTLNGPRAAEQWRASTKRTVAPGTEIPYGRSKAMDREGERKQVTVLFADVAGSMEFAEGIDPEEWGRTMDRLFSILAAGVHRFEGTVDKFTGDGIMALFGAPVAQE